MRESLNHLLNWSIQNIYYSFRNATMWENYSLKFVQNTN